MGQAIMNKAKAAVRILIVDDHPLVRASLCSLIGSQPDMILIGEAADAPTALELVTSRDTDLVILDITLKTGSGLELVKDILVNRPRTRVLVVSVHDESLYAERCLLACSRGYVMKSEPV